MGALLLGRMLTRPDMGAALGDFITWAEVALREVSQLAAPFLLPGEPLHTASLSIASSLSRVDMSYQVPGLRHSHH